MTKIIILILVLVVIQRSLEIPEEKAECDEKDKTKNKRVSCFSYLDNCIRQEMRIKGYSDDPNYKKYVLCSYVRIKFLTEDGELNCERIYKYIKRIFPKNVDSVYEKCAKQLNTPEETAFMLNKCIIENKKKTKKAPAKKDDDE